MGALETLPAGTYQCDHHTIADCDFFHADADFLHGSRRFVPVDRWQIAAPGTIRVVNVAVTDGAGRDIHAHLAGSRCRELDFLDRERLRKLPADGGFDFHLFARIKGDGFIFAATLRGAPTIRQARK